MGIRRSWVRNSNRSKQLASWWYVMTPPPKKNICESILTHFYSLKDFEVVDEGGYSPLIVYVGKTVNDDRKNPNGYAIAIAHTNCYELKLAYQNFLRNNNEKIRAPL